MAWISKQYTNRFIDANANKLPRAFVKNMIRRKALTYHAYLSDWSIKARKDGAALPLCYETELDQN